MHDIFPTLVRSDLVLKEATSLDLSFFMYARFIINLTVIDRDPHKTKMDIDATTNIREMTMIMPFT